MNQDQIHNLYDERYAACYDEKFIYSKLAQPESEFEEKLLRSLLKPDTRWLDVACGTGYFLSRFPDIYREGLDLSPAMLKQARHVNPGVIFNEGNFLDSHPEWSCKWDCVSCMWYAYGLVDTLDQVAHLIKNLADWTSPKGSCFIPLADPGLISGVQLPYRAEYPMSKSHIQMSAVVWSFIEDNGEKIHHHQIAPSIEWMTSQLKQYFEHVSIEKYPKPTRNRSKYASWAWRRAEQSRSALIATGKRNA